MGNLRTQMDHMNEDLENLSRLTSRSTSSRSSKTTSARSSVRQSRQHSPSRHMQSLAEEVSKRLNIVNENEEEQHKQNKPILKQNSQKVKTLKDWLGSSSMTKILTRLQDTDVENKFLAWLTATKQDLKKLEIPNQFHIDIAIFLMPERFKTMARSTVPIIDSWSKLTSFFSRTLLGATNQMILLDRFNKENKKLLESTSAGFDAVALLQSKIHSTQAPLLAHMDPNLADNASEEIIQHTQEHFARILAQHAMDPSALKNAVILDETSSATELLASLNRQRAAQATLKTQKTGSLIGLLDTDDNKPKKSCVIHTEFNSHNTEECREILQLKRRSRDNRDETTDRRGDRNRDRKQDNAETTGKEPWCHYHKRTGHQTEDCITLKIKKDRENRPNNTPPRDRIQNNNMDRGQNTNFIMTEDGRKCFCKHCAAHKQTLAGLQDCGHCWKHSDVRTAHDSYNCAKCKYNQNVAARSNFPPPTTYQSTPQTHYPPQYQFPQLQYRAPAAIQFHPNTANPPYQVSSPPPQIQEVSQTGQQP